MRAEVKRAFDLLQSGTPAHVLEAIGLLQNTVFSFSMTVCGHREDAEDTMQEVLVKAIPYLSKFDDPKALTTWLYTVARNRCWMSRRRSKFAPREHLSLDELMPDAAELDHLREMSAAGPSPERTAIARQDIAALLSAVLKIPPSAELRSRPALLLRAADSSAARLQSPESLGRIHHLQGFPLSAARCCWHKIPELKPR